MMISDEIIVLHYTRFSEKAVILHSLSRNFGRRSFIVKDASRLMAYFQPLNILECDIVENPKSQLFSAKNFTESAPLSGIRTSMGKNSISMFMAEVLFRATKEGVEEPGLFEWCRREILLLNELSANYSNFHIRFLLDLAGAMGFSPAAENLLPFLDETASDVLAMINCDFAQSLLVPMSGGRRSEICERLIRYLEYHIDAPLKIRSLTVLAELF